jgi:DNA-binding NarL/FixJ family response regulator
MEVLRALARGLKNRDIADDLNVSVHTVEYHIHNLFLKLNASSRADVLMRAQRMGWLDMTEPLC